MTPILLKFDIGDLVYLLTEYENKVWMVTAVTIYPQGLHSYQITSGTTVSNHYEIELTKNKDDKLVKYE